MFETGSVADGPSGWTQRSQQELPVHLNWRRSTREPGSHIGPSAQVACAVRRLLISIRQPSTRTSMRRGPGATAAFSGEQDFYTRASHKIEASAECRYGGERESGR